MADPASLTISCLALGFSVASFAWQHLRKVDSVVCTLVANNAEKTRGTYQFSLANLGTRACLLRQVSVSVHPNPELHGMFIDNSQIVLGNLPQVIKAGEIYSVSVRTVWDDGLIENATEEAVKRGEKDPILSFVVRVVLWNPKGTRMYGEKLIAKMKIHSDNKGWQYDCSDERALQISAKETTLFESISKR